MIEEMAVIGPAAGLIRGGVSLVVARTAPASEDGVQLGGVKRDSRNQRLSSLQAFPPQVLSV